MAKAVRFYETGGPEVLRYEEVEVGDPGPGQVRLRHVAVGDAGREKSAVNSEINEKSNCCSHCNGITKKAESIGLFHVDPPQGFPSSTSMLFSQ